MRGSSHAGDNDGMKNERLSDKVAAQLRGLVSTQNLQPGDRLPAERALAVQLGVSRTALREAIAQLASQGLLTAGSAVAPTCRTRRACSAGHRRTADAVPAAVPGRPGIPLRRAGDPSRAGRRHRLARRVARHRCGPGEDPRCLRHHDGRPRQGRPAGEARADAPSTWPSPRPRTTWCCCR